ncbi:MAG: DNA-3-methyladenine glycosylase I [Anaerolineales bacterium]
MSCHLIQSPGIIRNRLKIESAIRNAQACMRIVKKYGSFSRYIWSFVEGKPLINRWQNLKELPAKTPLSDRISRDLKKEGFNFVGSTICYAFMQATRMVNDHTTDCFRYREVMR